MTNIRYAPWSSAGSSWTPASAPPIPNRTTWRMWVWFLDQAPSLIDLLAAPWEVWQRPRNHRWLGLHSKGLEVNTFLLTLYSFLQMLWWHLQRQREGLQHLEGDGADRQQLLLELEPRVKPRVQRARLLLHPAGRSPWQRLSSKGLRNVCPPWKPSQMQARCERKEWQSFGK